MRQEFVARARALVGVRFRPQGRLPAIGLDCVGVVLNTFAIPAKHVPTAYRLRGDHAATIRSALQSHFNEIEASECVPGDVVLVKVGAEQVHLVVWCGRTFIHADAAIGMVVETPGPLAWRTLSVHRFRTSKEV